MIARQHQLGDAPRLGRAWKGGAVDVLDRRVDGDEAPGQRVGDCDAEKAPLHLDGMGSEHLSCLSRQPCPHGAAPVRMVVRQESGLRALQAAAVSADNTVQGRGPGALPDRPTGGALAFGIAAQAASFKSRGASAEGVGGGLI